MDPDTGPLPCPAHIRSRYVTKSFFRPLLPLLTGVLIIATAGTLIHLYRSTWVSGPLISPVLPRAQFSFSVRLPENRTGSPLPLLLRVVKTGNSFLSVAYWPVGRTVFQMPVLAPPAPAGHPEIRTIRLALWDPGRYTVTFEDGRTGSPVQSTSIRVAAPLGLYRNDLILLVLLGVAGYLSGRLALSSLPVLPGLSRLASFRRWLFPFLLAGATILILSAGPPLHPGSATGPQSAISSGGSPAGTGFLESEGRSDAPRMILPLEHGTDRASGGYLSLRHRLDSWLRFGQDLTLFEGPVDTGSPRRAFILPPDDGRYRLSLWTGEKGVLTLRRTVVSAIPVSPAFPLALFTGLTLFAFSFFLLGFTRNLSVPFASPAERLR